MQQQFALFCTLGLISPMCNFEEEVPEALIAIKASLLYRPGEACGTEGSPVTNRNHPVKTQTFDFLYIFACNTSQMQVPCNIRLSLAYNHDKQILSGFL